MPARAQKGKNMSNYIDCREKPDVFSRRYCYHYPEKLDIEAMRDAVQYLIGPKNFTSFTDDKECKDPIRRIINIKIVSTGEKVRITYYGTGFLYHMVRILTGTLLEIGTREEGCIHAAGGNRGRRQEPCRFPCSCKRPFPA